MKFPKEVITAFIKVVRRYCSDVFTTTTLLQFVYVIRAASKYHTSNYLYYYNRRSSCNKIAMFHQSSDQQPTLPKIYLDSEDVSSSASTCTEKRIKSISICTNSQSLRERLKQLRIHNSYHHNDFLLTAIILILSPNPQLRSQIHQSEE